MIVAHKRLWLLLALVIGLVALHTALDQPISTAFDRNRATDAATLGSFDVLGGSSADVRRQRPPSTKPSSELHDDAIAPPAKSVGQSTTVKPATSSNLGAGKQVPRSKPKSGVEDAAPTQRVAAKTGSTVQLVDTVLASGALGAFGKAPKLQCDVSGSSSNKARCRPNVFFIGVSKCATSTMILVLEGAKGVIADRREDHTMQLTSDSRQIQRAARVDVDAKYVRADNMIPIVHYCPALMTNWALDTSGRILRSFPYSTLPTRGARFLVMIREPVARAVSSYYFKNRKGTPASCTAALRKSIGLRKEFSACLELRLKAAGRSDTYPKPLDLKKCTRKPPKRYTSAYDDEVDHVNKGFYAEALRAWFTIFPAEHFMVVSLEEFATEPLATSKAVLRFLGVSHEVAFASEQDLQGVATTTRNKHRKPGNPDQSVLDELGELYKPANRDLKQLLGKDFGYPT